MALTFSLAPSAKWYFADAQGRPAAGGTMQTFLNSDRSTPKFIFQDPAGLNPYPNPMRLDASGGTEAPMYWDVTTPGLYYVVIKDSSGNIITVWPQFPIIGGGGVSPITSNTDLENHLINGQFLFIDAVNETDSIVNPIPQGESHLAPGSGFFKNTNGEYVSSITPGTSSGWSFFKAGGVGATDTVRFQPVSVLGAGPPLEPTANATRYFEFTLSGLGTAYTDASLRNVIPNVELFQNEILTISFDSYGTFGAAAAFKVEQFMGTGVGPAPQPPVSHAFNFSNSVWARQFFTITVPSLVGGTKGALQDDCLIISWQMPLGVIGTFRLANLQIQRGSFALEQYIEQTYAQDQYKVLIDLLTVGNILYRTGDYMWSDNGSLLFPGNRPGWLILLDITQTLGKTSASLASTFGLQYKNLYILWWTIYPQTECIVNGGRGATAIADFNADKRMTIPQHIIGAVFASAGVPLAPLIGQLVGAFVGEPTHQLTIPELPAHTHTIPAPVPNIVSGGANAGSVFGTTNSGATGADMPHNNMQPTVYKYLFVKL